MSEQIEGRNAVLEAFRSGKCVDKLFILDGCQDGPVRTIAREARKTDTIINYVSKERLDQLSETHAHQGVIARLLLMIIVPWMKFLQEQRKKVRHRSLLFWIMWKIRIILEQLSVPQILQERME